MVKVDLVKDEMVPTGRLNGDIGSQLEGWLGGNRFGHGQYQLELNSTKPRGHVRYLGGG